MQWDQSDVNTSKGLQQPTKYVAIAAAFETPLNITGITLIF